MILKYVLKNFTRRKVRTVLMILALLVSTGLIVTMSATVEFFQQSIVDIIASDVGRADRSVLSSCMCAEILEPSLLTSAVSPAAFRDFCQDSAHCLLAQASI